MKPTPLESADDPLRFGGKAAALSQARSAGLPVPDGLALEADLVDAIVARDPDALAALAGVWSRFQELLAVRSSAIGEDGAQHSFAGLHASVLGVASLSALEAAVRRIHASARAPAALAYRARRGVRGEPRMGIVVQTLVPARVAGIMFTQDPIRGDDVLVIEAALGLGEVVVAGDVTPDRFRVDRGGRVLDSVPGEQDTALFVHGGEVRRTPLARDPTPCLDAGALAELYRLAARLDQVWTPPHDVEFAFSDAGLALLQRRPLTAPRR